MDLVTNNSRVAIETDKYLLFGLNENIYALSVAHIISINIEKNFEQMVGSGEHVKGVITYLDEVIQVTDLHSLFGIPPYEKDFGALMNRHLQEHEEWLAALERAVESHIEFTGVIDPRDCAFGQWCETFTTENRSLATHMRSVDQLHTEIHKTVREVQRLLRDRRWDEAQQRVEVLKQGEFATMMQMLSQATAAYLEGLREVVVIYESKGKRKGMLVDYIVAVDSFNEQFQLPDLIVDIPYFERMARTKAKGRIVTVLRADSL